VVMKVTAWGRGAASASPARPCRSSDIAPQYSRKSLLSMQSSTYAARRSVAQWAGDALEKLDQPSGLSRA
jgi:hypothetical protein